MTDILRRIIVVIGFGIIAVVFIASTLFLPLMGMAGMFIYIFHGNKNDYVSDFILFPYKYLLELPFKIFGEDL